MPLFEVTKNIDKNQWKKLAVDEFMKMLLFM